MMNEDVLWVDPDSVWGMTPDGRFTYTIPISVKGTVRGKGDTFSQAQENANQRCLQIIVATQEFMRQMAEHEHVDPSN